jgi:hypothetical protein
MRWVTVATVALSLVVSGRVGAEAVSREDAPQALKEALQSGQAQPADIRAIIDWVLHEKEEKVAAGFAEVLRTLDAPGQVTGRDGDRWAPTVSAMFDLFGATLRDAQTHRSRRGSDVPPELSTLLRVAAPAIAASLREADPKSLEPLRAAAAAFGQAAGQEVVPDLVRALRHEDATIRRGAATALSALGPVARVAVPELKSALEDPDPDVRAAARQALTQLGEKVP